MDDFELELKHDFLAESADLLEAAEDAFLRLEDERNNPELLNEIFRLAHNLKGTSKAVGFDQLAELTHVAENLILKLKEGTFEADNEVVSVLLEFKDKVNEMVEGLKANVEAMFEIAELQEKLEKISNGERSETNEESVSTVADESVQNIEESLAAEDIPVMDDDRFEDAENLQDEIVNETVGPSINQAALDSLREAGLNDEGFDESNGSPEAVVEPVANDIKLVEEQPAPVEAAKPAAAPAAKAKTAPAADNDESIRVKLSRIGQINDVIGELVILQTVISQRRYEFIQDELSNKSIGMMGKLFKEVQELAMSLRMLPLKGTFQKMNRIVRDTSKTLDKNVKLHMVGDETEVDKTVLEKLADPLVHIVRNAVDHGLEAKGEREAAGKSPQGNVELMAYHEGSNLVIQVTDDGKGIDPNVIRNKAIEKKVLDANSTMSDHEVIQLIFHPGFSTKEQVTEVSGRGVGMDVVKTNIEALGGEVKLMSKLGEGSSLKIVLPLTLAIIEGIVITAKEEKFVVPLSQVFEISQVKRERVEDFSGIAKLFKLRGEVLPLFFINSKLNMNVDHEGDYTVIIIRGLNYAFGVVVDDILNQQQIVIKNLGEDIRNQKGIMGSAIMSDGRPSLILDVYELFKDDLKTSKGYKKFVSQVNNAA